MKVLKLLEMRSNSVIKNKAFLEVNYLKKVIVIALLMNCIIIKAQTTSPDYINNLNNLSKYTLESPDVYSFEKYSLSNVNHYVGKPEISLPIYTIKTGNIEYPLNLVYNSGGVKVDQLASDVGLGWALSSSVITRTINGANDFDNTGSLVYLTDTSGYSSTDLTQDSNASYPGNVLHLSPKLGYFLQKQINHKINIDRPLIDFIPDTYHFYANGYSTSFFFNDVNTPVEINPKGTKIQATASKLTIDTKRGVYNMTSGSGFQAKYNFPTNDFFTIVITTNEGIRYTFSDCDYAVNQQFNASDLLHESPAQISAWHITKIEDLKTGKKIDFVYEITSSNPNGSNMPNGYNSLLAQRSFEYLTNVLTGISNVASTYCYYYSNPLNNYTLINSTRVDVQKKRLKQIIFDEGEIDFNYNNIGISGQTTIVRNDLYNGDCVTQIYLKDKNLNLIKSFKFNYDYFTSNYNVGEFNPDNTQNSYRYKRLKLLNFGEIGNPVYNFSYNETVKLPPVNSFSIDFLGYYNGSTDISTPVTLTDSKPNPTLYYYPNNFEKSLLPFPVPNVTPATIIPGFFNRQANFNYAKAWSLNQVTYPTGGSSQYNYESNQFEVLGQNINGGGLRIVSQILNDGLGNIRTINYSYNKNLTTTSGTLAAFPFFGHPTYQFFSVSLESQADPHTVVIPNATDPFFTTPTVVNDTKDWRLFDKSNLNEDITSGAYVGYSRVVEREIGKGSRELKFTANEPGFKNEIMRITSGASNANPIYTLNADANGNAGCMGDFIIANSAMGNNIFTDNSYKRGKLLEENIFNESNQLLKKTVINYNENLLNTYSFQNGTTYPIYSQDPEAGLSSLFNSRKDFKIAQYLPITKTTSTFNALGSQSDKITNFTYNSKGFLTTKEDIVTSSESNKIQYFYPQDTQMAGEPFISNLIVNNIIAIPLNVQTFRNTEKIAEKKIIYTSDATTNNLLQPKYVYAKKGTDLNGTLEKKITYDLYDDKGNLIQYTTTDGIPVTLVWGYNKTLLIAKIENATYSSLSSLIVSAQTASNTGIESALSTALSNLRNSSLLSNAFVTSYTHIPLKGISTVTDAKGYITYYYYDAYGRLISIKDATGNLVKENQYNYKPQP